MDPQRDPEYLRFVADSVMSFADAFADFMALHVENTTMVRGLAPAALPRQGVTEEQVIAAQAKVDHAAGLAMDAVPLTRTYVGVQGAGKVDPIASWGTITQPKPLLEPTNVRSAVGQIMGKLEAMVRRAEVEASTSAGVESLHPLVWGAASRLWRDGHFREAVVAGANALIAAVKDRSGRHDLPETALWQELFSVKPPEVGKPRLRWPGAPEDQTVKAMTDGLRQFAPGVQMTVRNPAVHTTEPMSEQDALERLAVLSLLARWALDECDLDQTPPTGAVPRP